MGQYLYALPFSSFIFLMYVIAGMTKGEGLRVFRKMIRDKTNPIFGYRYTTKPRLGPLNWTQDTDTPPKSSLRLTRHLLIRPQIKLASKCSEK